MKEITLVHDLGCKEATRRDRKTGRVYRYDGRVYYEVRRDGLYPADVKDVKGHNDWVGVK